MSGDNRRGSGYSGQKLRTHEIRINSVGLYIPFNTTHPITQITMRNFITFLLILAVLALGLYVTNPTPDDFREYLKNELKEEIPDRYRGKDRFVDDIFDWASGTIANLATINMQHENHHLYSIFILEFPGEEIRYIGIGFWFIELK